MSIAQRHKLLSEEKETLQLAQKKSKDFDEKIKLRDSINLINIKIEVVERRRKGHWKQDHPETYILIPRT